MRRESYMKRCTLALFALLLCAFARPAQKSPARWEGPLFIVSEQKIITPEPCSDGTLPRNSKKSYPRASKGTKYILLTSQGPTSVTSASVTCATGPCNGDYVAIDLVGAPSSEKALIAVRPSEIVGFDVTALGDPIDSTDTPKCTEVPDIPNLSLPEVIGRRRCDEWKLGTSPQAPLLQLLARSFGVKQEEWNGWNMEYVFIRTVRKTSHGYDAGKWAELDKGSVNFNPSFVLTGHGVTKIIWMKSEGECCPDKTTAVVSTLTSDGKMTFGHPYVAGGQPCDTQ